MPASVGSSGKKPLPNQKERNRENELEPGKWTDAKIGRKSHAVPIDKIRCGRFLRDQ
jgi:hypothetical protein